MKILRPFFIIFMMFMFGCTPMDLLLPQAGKFQPKLITPKDKDILLISNINSTKDKNWLFDWEDIPNAEAYHLIIYNIKTNEILYNIYTLTKSKYLIRANSKLTHQRKDGWVWSVKAKINGKWMDWAMPRKFEIQ